MAGEILDNTEEFDNPTEQETAQEDQTPVSDSLQDLADAQATDEQVFVEPETEEQSEETDAEIPDKYRGKSLAEVARMHQEAEKLLGKQGQEVGEYRKIIDQHIMGQLSQQHQEEEQEVDFFEDPETAVSRAIEKHPAIQRATQTAEEYRRSSATSKLKQQHPDAVQILQDDKFRTWVNSSPVRKQMYDTANNQYVPELASELLTLYKERAGAAQQVAQAEQQERKRQVQRGATGATSGASQAGSGKRIYRRADIIKLMKQDPDRYEALSGEIMKAYQEGRVR